MATLDSFREQLLRSWLASGGLADIVLFVTALEAAGLTVLHRRTGRGLSPGSVLRMLLPGVFIVLALRVALASGAWPWIAACLALAGITHATDLALRLRSR